MVLGDFVQRVDERKVENRKSISIDKNNFDDVLAKQDLQLTLSVPNHLQRDGDVEELAVNVSVSSMSDFNPASLVQQVPELKKLMELRDALMALKGPLGNAPAFRKAIENVLINEASRTRVLGELGFGVGVESDLAGQE
ncbi:type VI secretion system contractile sheath small subunit [Pseudomonas floridensis]|uniref:type VI secretion system contractile sheath small subunit n=1 Tax=Pseudomonas floridensis TaxID=1958950 RepID=UPI001FCA30EB|nr:type VI secretion system contractile sheath small subunit [Pseudomonas floridensis]